MQWQNAFTRLGVLCAVLLLTGCSGWQSGLSSGSTRGSKSAQDQPIDYANGMPLRIERCYWASEINKMDDYDQAFMAGPGATPAAPRMIVKAQDQFLIVEMSLTNTNDRPLTPDSPPIFQLVNEKNTKYSQLDGTPGLTQKLMERSNINPGRSIKGRAIFDVPKEGNYDLHVYLGQWVGNGFGRGQRAGIWQLQPTQ